MRPVNKKVISALAATGESSAIKSGFQLSCSLQALASSTIAGAVKIQFSNDPENTTPTNWSDITGATVTLTGTAGVFAIPKIDITYNWIKIVFTKSGGTGAIDVNYQSFGF